MDITWYGKSCFRLRGRSAAVLTDPGSFTSSKKLSRLESEVITLSSEASYQPHTKGDKSAFVISGPGEYEVAGVSVLGFPTGSLEDNNTTYLIQIDELRICHLGNLNQILGDAEIEKLDKIDVALVPVGEESLKISDSAELVRQLDPKVVVPMVYSSQPLSIQQFLKEMGMPELPTTNKLNIQASTGESETRLVHLEPQLA